MRGEIRYLFLAIAAAILLSMTLTQAKAADSPWPMIHGDSKLTGQSIYDTSKIGGKIKWEFKTKGQMETSPVIAADGTIYIADQACNLYAIDSNGREKWRFNAGDPVHSIEWGGESCFQASPSIASDGTIYIAPMSGYLHAISPEGKEKWKYPVFNFKNNWSSPAIGQDGTIYLGSEAYPPKETGKPQEKPAFIYAINPDGTLKWAYDTKGNWSTSTGSIAQDGTVYMSGNECNFNNNCENVLFAFNGQTGEVKWRFYHGGVMESSASLGSDGTIYFGIKGKNNPRQGAKFFAVTPEGKEKWSFDAPCGNSIIPAIASNGTIYWGDWDGGFYAISPEGKIIWKVDTPKTFETLSSSPAIGKEGTIYFGSLANHFFAYAPDGQLKWKHYFPDGGINSSPAIGKDGTVYVAFVPGKLIAFGEGMEEGNVQENKNADSGAQGQGLKQPINEIKKLLLCGILILIVSGSLALYFIKRKLRWAFWLLLIIFIVISASFIFLFFKSDANMKKIKDSQPEKQGIITMEEMYKTGEDFDKTCPEKIRVDYDNYTAVLGNKEWKLDNMRQIDWISEKCPNTVWPR